MDDRLVNLYEQELKHLRETLVEFGRAFPTPGRELALRANPADPYIERLLDGVAFMAARVRLKLDSQFPQFTQSLLETIYPDFLSPMPSLAVLQFQPPEPATPPPPGGSLVRRGSIVRGKPRKHPASQRGLREPLPCSFTLAQDVRLLPIELTEAGFPTQRLHETSVGEDFKDFDVRSALRLRFRKTVQAPWSEIAMDPLVLYVPAADGLGFQILHHLFAHQLGISLRDGSTSLLHRAGHFVRKVGFDRKSAVLPPTPRTFEGYRLLREYFALPERFLFFELHGFKAALSRCKSPVLELIIPLSKGNPDLERDDVVNKTSFKLFCTPAINLFAKSFNQVIEPERFIEFHVQPDANRPLEQEVYSVDEVKGVSDSDPDGRQFLPFFQARRHQRVGAAFFTLDRQVRMFTEKERKSAVEIPYAGSEVFISLVDTRQVPFAGDLQQLVFNTHCTNRHLPILLREDNASWSLEGSVKAKVDTVVEPTVPTFRPVDGEYAWQLLNLFSLNYLTLSDAEDGNQAALRDLLALYVDDRSEWAQRQISSLRRVQTHTIHRPLYADIDPDQAPTILSIVRGLEVILEFDAESVKEPTHRLFGLGSVLEEFFATYVSLNSFAETVIRTWPDGDEWMRWPCRLGLRQLL
jgi:type VI secretion system protein ImpG